jgi:hypothetical protein
MNMAKKPSAIYEPGELEKVRGRLGPVDESEAKLIAKKLGGEIGTEKSVVTPPIKKPGYVRRGNADLSGSDRKNRQPARPANTAQSDDEYGRSKPGSKRRGDVSDDPSIQLKTSYFERVKMDRYAAQPEFEIKNSLQVFLSVISFFGEPADNVNPRFITNRMSAYYKKIELLVNATRALSPRNNAKRSERLKKASPYYFSIVEVFRHWDIERIDDELTKIKASNRRINTIDFAEILRNIYRPLFMLEKLNMDTHIKGAFKVLYKVICVEDPSEPRERIQELIRIALGAFSEIKLDVHFGLYPLLMKYISDRWLPYERLFIERRRRLMSFLSLTENDQIKPLDPSAGQTDNADIENIEEDIIKEEDTAEVTPEEGVDPEEPQSAEKKAREEAAKIEKRAMDQSVKVLESLFPKAGWERLEEYPDLYPYFVNTYQLRRGFELIGPSDPLQQVAILMHIMEDICVGLRNVTFSTATGPDGNPAQINELIGSIITNWRRYIDDSFNKEYLPRLIEYCGIIEHSAESRISTFAKKTLNGIHWIKRLYYLPYYKFESVGPPPFQKQDVVAIYSEVRTLRKYLTLVASGIEQGNRIGGAEAKAHCNGIANPWNRYNFEIPNPVSRRIDALLAPEKRNNTALVFFALSVIAVLDNLLNNENSWAYGEKTGPVFRSVNNLGVTPVFGIDNKLDADRIFKEEMKKKQQEKKNT